ncbi:hypothetical protein [Vibrio phage LV6]|nr:hypothetical protein [Vibrio phage LV6]
MTREGAIGLFCHTDRGSIVRIMVNIGVLHGARGSARVGNYRV